jgi:hypothetical protein
MALEINLGPAELKRLEQRARSAGYQTEEYVRMSLGLRPRTARRLPLGRWDALLEALGEDVSADALPLSDDAVSRRVIYTSRA